MADIVRYRKQAEHRVEVAAAAQRELARIHTECFRLARETFTHTSERIQTAKRAGKSDEEVEAFLDQDLTDYLDLDNFTVVRFEFLPKTKKVNLRVPEALLEAVRQQAKQEGISYQKYIRRAVDKVPRGRPTTPRIIPGVVARPILSG